MTEPARKTIRCTQDNAHEVRALMARWPEFGGLVRSLHKGGLIDGLRSVQITLTGSENFVAQGLAAVMSENAPQAAKSAAIECEARHG